MRSMLPNPHSLCAAVPKDDIIGYFRLTGLLSTEVVLRTTPAHPAFSPSIAISSSSVGGAADRISARHAGLHVLPYANKSLLTAGKTRKHALVDTLSNGDDHRVEWYDEA